MQATLIYIIAYACAVVFLLGWRLSQSLTTKVRKRILSVISKWTVITVPIPRVNESSDLTVLSMTLVIVIITGNVVAALVGLQERETSSLRLARLSSINMVFLYMGGRTNIVVDKLFRLSHSEYWLLHRWLGRIAVIEGVVHGGIQYTHSKSQPSVLQISVRELGSLCCLK